MHLISRKALVDFSKIHSDADAPMRNWFKAIERGTFASLVELKTSFASVDYLPVGQHGLYVFNVGGNKYRIVASIHFNRQRLYVRNVLTHAEYSKGEWRK
jgi:mRNA interferase HigB